MDTSAAFRQYLRGIERYLGVGDATEHTHRPALKTLLESLAPEVTVINEPKRIECGAPDFNICRDGTPIGHIEAKDIGESLDRALRSKQLKRYLAALPNLILTDYLEFRWFVNGEERSESVQLARLTPEGRLRSTRESQKELAALLEGFLSQEPISIGKAEELAKKMAALARIVRELIEGAFQREPDGKLHAELAAFQKTLIPDLSPEQFADMYAQTIAYGLFAARAHRRDAPTFTRQSAAQALPPTNPFLRRLFDDIAGIGLDERIAWAVDDLAQLLSRANMEAILEHFAREDRERDPTLHFYEDFLRQYDPRERRRRGVYYTPEAVVSYIVHSLDWLLRERFGRPRGLADEGVYILDPAVGTGTFLYFVIRQIHQIMMRLGQRGAWQSYVREGLLPRIFGFELMMAPYTIAHMKLGVLLGGTGYDFAGRERLGIYLTNALEEAVTRAERLPFAGYLAEEGEAAAEVKREKPIMVVLGNPPYSVSSANRGQHIERLMESYKEAVRGERNIQPLSDDYIKFIRFAQDRIERTGYGLVGMITNNSYLSGLIHRGMRQELLKAFDEIYVLNLHGDSRIGETAPDGGPDQNVFDIQQGVGIALFMKEGKGEGLARVRYADLWGLREGKYEYLLENDLSATQWQELEPEETPSFFFVPKELDLIREYEKGWSMVDIFALTSTGIKTHRDHFVIDFDETALRARIATFRDPSLSDEEARERFNLGDSGTWKLADARHELQRDSAWQEAFTLCLYRPFDVRSLYYHDALVERSRREVMRHMLAGENVALIACRQFAARKHFTVFCSDELTEISSQPYAPFILFPLYLYSRPSEQEGKLFAGGEAEREPNLNPRFVAELERRLGLRFQPHPIPPLPASGEGSGGGVERCKEGLGGEVEVNGEALGGRVETSGDRPGGGVETHQRDPDSEPRRTAWRTPPELWEKLKPLARQMRRQPTPAEAHLWQRLRKHQLRGFKFRRQHAIDRFIVDFYCAEAQLVIEIDGPIHDYTPEQDALRQEFLESLSLRVLRFKSQEVLDSPEDVLARIAAHLPLPACGEGLGGGVEETTGEELEGEVERHEEGSGEGVEDTTGEGPEDGGTFTPEDIFHYAYAVFHSPTYRERYAEFLKIDFPRLPLTSDLALFRALAEKGEELVAHHLMKSPKLADFITRYPVPGSNEVERPRYLPPSEGKPARLYINREQYFQSLPPQVWEFQIGGYQVLRTWLRYRRGRELAWDDLDHFQRVAVALKETIRLMEQIDQLIPSWPLE